jgi:predicted amidohydrolase
MPDKIKIALAQIAPKLGDVKANLELHFETLAKAQSAGADLIIFPELSLTGYLLKDMVPEAALRADSAEMKKLLKASEKSAVIFGLAEEDPSFVYYNSACFADRGKIAHIHRKVFLPTYGMFDEGRFFGEGNGLKAFDTRFGKVGMLICEEAWHPFCPYLLMLDGAVLTVNIANGTGRGLEAKGRMGSSAIWEKMNRFYSDMHQYYWIFVNRVGFEDGVGFWGGSEIIDPFGQPEVKLPYFEEKLHLTEISLEKVRRARLRTPLLRDEKLDFAINEMLRIRGSHTPFPSSPTKRTDKPKARRKAGR